MGKLALLYFLTQKLATFHNPDALIRNYVPGSIYAYFMVPTYNNFQSINFFPLFQVSVPQASRVAVVVGGEWTHLEQNASGVWEGAAFFQAGWGKEDTAALTANYGSDSASYNTLLEFRM